MPIGLGGLNWGCTAAIGSMAAERNEREAARHHAVAIFSQRGGGGTPRLCSSAHCPSVVSDPTNQSSVSAPLRHAVRRPAASGGSRAVGPLVSLQPASQPTSMRRPEAPAESACEMPHAEFGHQWGGDGGGRETASPPVALWLAADTADLSPALTHLIAVGGGGVRAAQAQGGHAGASGARRPHDEGPHAGRFGPLQPCGSCCCCSASSI